MGFGFLIAKKREKFLQQNGALLLEDKLKNMGARSMKIFSAKTLQVATRNYASYMVLGNGSSGYVYRGILPDNRVVAIKKAWISESWQSEQFVNELVIISQINHQNVVQLLGCCLETEVPLLAYEYVSNGDLGQHIHDIGSGTTRLSWDSRLSIAYDTASALAYPHTGTRASIVHGDLKPSNILLDGNLTAKIANFGASRFIPLDDDEGATTVVGTLGYLDPEYFHTGQLSDKSDVYSFGVVLAELLTGKKPLNYEREESERNLATYFMTLKIENRLPEIVDHQVFKEATDEQLTAACDLTCRCLHQRGENRPSMKEVAMELETIRKLGEHLPLIDQDNYAEPHNYLLVESEQVDLHSDISENYSDSNFSDILRNNDICFNVVYPR